MGAKKQQQWQSVTYISPSTGRVSVVEAPANSCPSCGQRRCTRRDPDCVAVQHAISIGKRILYSV